MATRLFDTERDKQSPCFCEGCLVGKTESQMSKRDIRYCLECQPLIEEDYEQRKEAYIPVTDAIPVSDIVPYTEKAKTKLSTLNSPSLTVDNFRPRGRPTTYKKRPLPDEKIKQLHKEGMGTKAIATRLKKEQGIPISYKTIQRVLSGQRN